MVYNNTYHGSDSAKKSSALAEGPFFLAEPSYRRFVVACFKRSMCRSIAGMRVQKHEVSCEAWIQDHLLVGKIEQTWREQVGGRADAFGHYIPT